MVKGSTTKGAVTGIASSDGDQRAKRQGKQFTRRVVDRSDSDSEVDGDDQHLNRLAPVETTLRQEVESQKKHIRTVTCEVERLRDQLTSSRVECQKREDEKRVLFHQTEELKETVDRIQRGMEGAEDRLRERNARVAELEQQLHQRDTALRQQSTSVSANQKSLEAVVEVKNQLIEKLEARLARKDSKLARLKKDNRRLAESARLLEEEAELAKGQVNEMNGLRRKGLDGLQAEGFENQSLRDRV